MARSYQLLTESVVAAALEVHGKLGNGFLERVYLKALAYELALRRIRFETEVALRVSHKGQAVGQYKADFVVNRQIVLELKTVSQLTSAHLAQAQNYLAATGLPLAILLNFGAAVLEHVPVRPGKLPRPL